ncbi:MAG: hypothetical protein IJT48_03155, partial [Bacteroidaceae bacterium]|nr:hypothetical protein [Bacteroidaceae bacterium]
MERQKKIPFLFCLSRMQPILEQNSEIVQMSGKTKENPIFILSFPNAAYPRAKLRDSANEWKDKRKSHF